ncbi:MAG: hypothetical protein ACRDUA_14570 [Micromonosporaceae bacterium]
MTARTSVALIRSSRPASFVRGMGTQLDHHFDGGEAVGERQLRA